MLVALREAEAARRAGDLAIGALLMIDSHLVARGRSRQRQRGSPLAHAELEVLQRGQGQIGTAQTADQARDPRDPGRPHPSPPAGVGIGGTYDIDGGQLL